MSFIFYLESREYFLGTVSSDTPGNVYPGLDPSGPGRISSKLSQRGHSTKFLPDVVTMMAFLPFSSIAWYRWCSCGDWRAVTVVEQATETD